MPVTPRHVPVQDPGQQATKTPSGGFAVVAAKALLLYAWFSHWGGCVAF